MQGLPLHRLLHIRRQLWCHQNKRYVNPEDSICEEYKPKIKGPLDKYI
ncbi:MAG: hypothetical protein QMD13_04930 [Candidatus Bathyarchaeia archaeon]|nr:hypothetical protein [Candidatus Bathyarchaeia archaeon]